MSERVIKKLEISKGFLSTYQTTKERLNEYGVENFTISDYIDFLNDTITTDQLEVFIENQTPLKVKLLRALEMGDETLILQMKKLLEKQNSFKVKKSNQKNILKT